MTDQQVLWHLKNKIHEASLQGANYAIEAEDVELINSVLSEPAETGGAKELLGQYDRWVDNSDPRKSVYTFMECDVLDAMNTYAAQRCAEKDRDIAELEKELKYKDQYYNSSISVNGSLLAKNKQLQSELTEANKRIAELEGQIKYFESREIL